MEQSGNDRKLSFLMLMAMIIGSTIGSGIFTVTADMAATGAHTGAILIGWLICGVGMMGLVMSFFGLNKVKPELTNGIYSYAKEGFGEYIGFSSAWGYWISALLCNVSYATLLFGAIGYFFPVFGDGNNVISVVGGSVLIWILCFLVMKGVKEAAVVNIITTIAKLVPLLVFVVAIIFVRSFDPQIFMQNFWGDGTVSLGAQIKNTTAATVWSFIGIEGAVVLSARAKKSSDVGKASLAGFLGILAIYVLVAILSLGTVPIEEMANYPNPQLAYVLETAVGPWGAGLINLGVIVSLAGSLLGWTVIAADTPYSTAQQGMFMKIFAKENKNEAPGVALFITNLIIQIFLIIVLFNESTYQVFYGISTGCIVYPYLISAAYYLKLNIKGEGMDIFSPAQKVREKLIAVVGVIYGLWMVFAMGKDVNLIATVLYAFGNIVYLLARKESGKVCFEHTYEKIIAIAMVVVGVIALVMTITGTIQPF